MATIYWPDGRQSSDLAAIQQALAPLGIALHHWPLAEQPLLSRSVLDDAEKSAVLDSFEHYFAQLQQSAGYQTRDLVVLHDAVPNLDELLRKFDRCHTHSDDEVRYIIDGEGVFGFVLADGSQIELRVCAGDYINVPAQVEHWFHLTALRRIKAIRYFTSTAGWVPEYTGTAIADNFG